MDVREFEVIKKKLETLKDKRSRYQGTLDSITSQLKELGLDSIEEAQAKAHELEATIEENKALQDSLFAELKECHSWQFV